MECQRGGPWPCRAVAMPTHENSAPSNCEGSGLGPSRWGCFLPLGRSVWFRIWGADGEPCKPNVPSRLLGARPERPLAGTASSSDTPAPAGQEVRGCFRKFHVLGCSVSFSAVTESKRASFLLGERSLRTVGALGPSPLNIRLQRLGNNIVWLA